MHSSVGDEEGNEACWYNFPASMKQLLASTWTQHQYWSYPPAAAASSTSTHTTERLTRIRVTETRSIMTIRNTLRDYGQRYRPRMACLKKVGSNPFLHQASCALHLQTHLYVLHSDGFSAVTLHVHVLVFFKQLQLICILHKVLQRNPPFTGAFRSCMFSGWTFSNQIKSDILCWPHGGICLWPKCCCICRTEHCAANNKKHTSTCCVIPRIIMLNQS